MIDNSTAMYAIETNPLERIRESNLPLYRFLMKYSPSSRSTMLRYLAMIVDSVTLGEKPAKRSPAEVRQVVFEFPWSTLNYDAALKVKGSIEARQYSPSTQSTLLVCLRGIAAELWDLGILDDKPWQQIRKLKAKSGSRRKKSRYIPLEDLSRMLATCFDGTRLGKRDACLLAILYRAGLRRTEAAKLKISQVDRSAGSIRVHISTERESRIRAVKGKFDDRERPRISTKMKGFPVPSKSPDLEFRPVKGHFDDRERL